MRLTTLTLLAAVGVTACQPSSPPPPPPAPAPAPSATTDPATLPPAPPTAILPPPKPITALGMANVARTSKTSDASGIATAPFDGASVHFFGSGAIPKVGEHIHMWPLRPTPQKMDVTVTKASETPMCDGRDVKMFDATGSPSRMEEILAAKPDAGNNAEFPFQMAFAYPSQPGAKLVTPPSQLPPGVTAATVKFALDSNSDGAADALYAESDCDSGGPVTGATGSTCTASYVLRDAKWVLLNSTSPC